MSIVAERPVSAQVADRPGVGERADVVAIAAPRSYKPRTGPRYVRTAPGHGPDGLRLGRGEDPVMSAEQSAWVDELYLRYGRLVRSMVVNRLMGQGVEFAQVEQWRDDLVQQVWLSVARGQSGLRDMRDAEPADLRVRLHFLVKGAIGAHWKTGITRNEVATDWVDVVGRQMDPVAPPVVDVDGQDELTARCNELLDGLSDQMRAVVVELICYDRTTEMVAELLDMSPMVVNRLSQRALRRLRGDDAPSPARVEELSEAHRRVIESLPAGARAVLLLRIAGVSVDAISDHTGGSVRTIYKQLKTYLPLLDAGLPLTPQETARAQRREDQAAARRAAQSGGEGA
ncbi:sigma factor-like helix-turn-helix DNA-binding protein [Streptomyces marianii]|uniref:Sigma-70 family RNA polymerase sigma factor n=1 Tax=Streptomyces marianii TaxID=1817406 RepID=A0A5R9DQE9_9ACTN|nr:sigma factor-like helix-turn-helix DNA-binding protein [Streptomyces marianii]TLQ38601.1 sigma-70 family RNA polymerase sigma factor [Streptomyces marianii]